MSNPKPPASMPVLDNFEWITERNEGCGAPDCPPVDLGLVTALHAFAQQGTFGDNQPQTAELRVQLETLGGKSYFLSLTVETARSMILGISNWPPVQDYLLELAQPGAPIGLKQRRRGRLIKGQAKPSLVVD